MRTIAKECVNRCSHYQATHVKHVRAGTTRRVQLLSRRVERPHHRGGAIAGHYCSARRGIRRILCSDTKTKSCVTSSLDLGR